MNDHDNSPNLSVHENISALLPWYVNGTATPADRRKVETHLPACPACRADLDLERRIFARIAQPADVGCLPGPSFKRLQIRLERLAPGPSSSLAAARPPASRQRRLLAAAALLAAVLGLFATDGWRHAHGPVRADYYTVTTAAVHPADEAIRAVFAPTITVSELQAILARAQLRIVGGPSEAGVYSLASSSGLPTDSALAILRLQPAVRFAEMTQPPGGAGASR